MVIRLLRSVVTPRPWIRGRDWGGLICCGGGRAESPPQVEEVLKTKGFEGDTGGILVVDGTTGQTVYERNADQLFCPASVTKLFSTAAGPQRPRRRLSVSDSGRSPWRGEGWGARRGPDPGLPGRPLHGGTYRSRRRSSSSAITTTPIPLRTSTARSSVPTRSAALDHLARAVQAAGIKTITGDVLVDERFFEPTSSTGSGPSRVGPTVINDNVIDVVVTPAGLGGEAGGSPPDPGDGVRHGGHPGRHRRISPTASVGGALGGASSVLSPGPVAGGPQVGGQDL